VSEWLPRALAQLDAPARALDLAMGRGRHARLLARAGCRTFGVDAKWNVVREAVGHARAEGFVVRGWCVDLTTLALPDAAFDLVLVTRYLQRDLFRSIRESLRPGGMVMYETFTVHQRLHGVGPTSSHHLLEPGELARHFEAFDVLFYEETTAPEAVARLVARRPIRGSSGHEDL
jgi:SAM-dependent methyltransferase